MKVLFLSTSLLITFSALSLVQADSAVESSLISVSNGGGRRLYQKLCAQCHGKDGRPGEELTAILKPAPTNLQSLELEDEQIDVFLKKKIGSGNSDNQLHYEGSLSEEQIDALVQYVKSLVRR